MLLVTFYLIVRSHDVQRVRDVHRHDQDSCIINIIYTTTSVRTCPPLWVLALVVGAATVRSQDRHSASPCMGWTTSMMRCQEWQGLTNHEYPMTTVGVPVPFVLHPTSSWTSRTRRNKSPTSHQDSCPRYRLKLQEVPDTRAATRIESSDGHSLGLHELCVEHSVWRLCTIPGGNLRANCTLFADKSRLGTFYCRCSPHTLSEASLAYLQVCMQFCSLPLSHCLMLSDKLLIRIMFSEHGYFTSLTVLRIDGIFSVFYWEVCCYIWWFLPMLVEAAILSRHCIVRGAFMYMHHLTSTSVLVTVICWKVWNYLALTILFPC